MISEPHKIIEKEFTWSEFTSFLFESDCIEVDKWAHFKSDQVQLISKDSGEILNIHNGYILYTSFEEQMNNKIKYGNGIFYLLYKHYEVIKIGEDEFGNGLCETSKFHTVKETEIKLFKIQQY